MRRVVPGEVRGIDINEPQRRSLERINELLPGMHYADIRVRYNGEDYWFEADWLRDVVPSLITSRDEK